MLTNFIKHILITTTFFWTTHVAALPIDAETSLDSGHLIRLNKAKEIQQYLNVTADPCEDFFEFACGNFGKYHPTNTSFSQLDAIEVSMKKKLREVLEVDHPNDTDFDKKVKIFYRSCLKAPEVLDQATAKSLIQEFGQFPVLEGDKWEDYEFDWQKTLPQILARTAKGIIFDFLTYPKYSDPNLGELCLAEPNFELKDRSYYLDESIPAEREKYRQRIADNLHKFLGVERPLAYQTAQEILDFEVDLAQGMNDEKSAQQQTLTEYTQKELEAKSFPDCNFRNFIDSVIGFTPKQVWFQLTYVENALKVLKDTPKKTIANYIFYKYLNNYMFDLKDDIDTKEKFCGETTKELFYKNLVNLAYRRYFGEESKEGINFMWREMKSALKKEFSEPRLNWIHETSREKILHMLEEMHLEILTFEQNNFTEEFRNLQVDELDYISNMLAIQTLRGQQKNMTIDKTMDQFIITYLLPFFIHFENTIKIPIGVLQPHMVWSQYYPYNYNYAVLGVFIAHESLHGFDRSELYYKSSAGGFEQVWDDRSSTEFSKRNKCLHDQYHSYIYGGRPLGIETQSENIADNGAVRLAYKVYLEWLDKHLQTKGEEFLKTEIFPGLNYTHRQLYFINYAQMLCATTNPQYMITHAAGDVHVPEKFRVIGSLSNFEEFSKEFQCPKGSVMNPLKKCSMY